MKVSRIVWMFLLAACASLTAVVEPGWPTVFLMK
jgi:hypothetical protein